MSHAYMYVILPKEISDVQNSKAIQDEVDRLMTPFDENDETAYEEFTNDAGEKEHRLKEGRDVRWDWYSIGGRWNGVIRGKERNSDDGFNFGRDYREAPENACLVKDIVKAEFGHPSDVLLPDGTWIADGEMGWFGIRKLADGTVEGPFDEAKANAAWDEKVDGLLKQYAEHVVVGVDYHI